MRSSAYHILLKLLEEYKLVGCSQDGRGKIELCAVTLIGKLMRRYVASVLGIKI